METEVRVHLTPPNTLIFTDLDGTLLDDRYDVQASAELINALQAQGFAVVPVSSKTLSELSMFAANIDTNTPWVFENGAGIAWPDELFPRGEWPRSHGRAIQLVGAPYAQICDHITQLKQNRGFRFNGFSDMNIDEVARLTGLDTASAARAKDRLATEPLVWEDSVERLREFEQLLGSADLQVVHGGRFHHVMPMTDKGTAARQVLRTYRYVAGPPQQTIACGDSANDLPMLQLADICVICPQADGSYLPLPEKPAVHAAAPGPAGWSAAVQEAYQQCTPAGARIAL